MKRTVSTDSIRCTAPKNLEAMIVDGGFDNISQYGRNPNTKVSLETVRRAMKGTKLSSFTYFLILIDLGKSRKEIKSLLYEAGDRVLCRYIGVPEVSEEEDRHARLLATLKESTEVETYLSVLKTISALCEAKGHSMSHLYVELEKGASK